MAEPKQASGGYLYHPIHGKSGFMWNADMNNPKIGALALHPDEWKDRPWTDEEIAAYKRKQAEAEVKEETPQPEAPQAPAPTKHGLPRGRPRGRPFKKKEPQLAAE